MTGTSRTTIFKWGYEGWGNATPTLVRTVDAVERTRGYDGPIFVDIRAGRSVRAIGFRDDAFGDLLGHARYRWMRSLGNRAVRTGRGKMRIECPYAVDQLLDLAIDAASANRRVIFFCSCASPMDARDCHRGKVATLLLRAARRRGVQIELEEWPGGAPKRTVIQRLPVTAAMLSKVRTGIVAIPLTPRQASAAMSLPLGALVELVASEESQIVSVRAPEYRARRWQLPIFLHPVEEADTARSLAPWVVRRRAEWQLSASRS